MKTNKHYLNRICTSLIILFAVLCNQSSFAQSCTLVIDENFNQHAGANKTYTEALMKQDFGNTSGPYKGLDGRTNVGNGVIQAFFKKGALLGEETGFTWFSTLPNGGTEEAVMEYKLKFSKGYDWSLGGKLPGLCGGSAPRGCNEDQGVRDNGFTARIMWHRDAQMITYPYWSEMVGRCGENWYWKDNNGNGNNIRISDDTWHTIREHVKLNTPGVRNGIIEIFLDGNLVQKRTDLMFRKAGKNFKIDNAYITTYVGGSTDAFRPDHDQNIWFDDFKVWVNCSNPVNTNPCTNNSLPIVSLTSPANNSNFLKGSTITISANASDNGSISNVEFFDGTTSLGIDNSAPYSISLNALAVGTHSVIAKATDNCQAVKSSIAVSVTINPEIVTNTPPSVSFTKPLNNASLNAPASLIVNVNATDADGISGVKLYLNNVLIREELAAPYDWNHNAQDLALQNLAIGNYTLKAIASDLKGATAETSISVIVKSVVINPCIGAPAPIITITSPANNASFNEGQNIAINASASTTAQIAKVEFYNGTTLIATDNTAPYSFASSSLKEGIYTFTTKAFDNCTNSTSSAPLTFSVKKVIVSNDPISGPTCGKINQSLSYEINPANRTDASSYSWWFTGASQSVTPSVSGTSCVVLTNKYFNTGEICVGVRLTKAPYYIKYCKAVGTCANRLGDLEEGQIVNSEVVNVFPSPSVAGFVTIDASGINATPQSIQIINNLGEIVSQTQTTDLQTQISTVNLAQGTYTVKTIFFNHTVISKLIITK